MQDVNAESLLQAEQRWIEARGPETQHAVSFHTAMKSLPRQLDVAIVTTTADVRPQVVGEIAGAAKVRYWVLEKLLAQNEAGLDEIKSCVAGSSSAWVNTPRRMMAWHRQIRTQL